MNHAHAFVLVDPKKLLVCHDPGFDLTSKPYKAG